jgi:ethanolamine utilization protein EutP (predicted NTPase)
MAQEVSIRLDNTTNAIYTAQLTDLSGRVLCSKTDIAANLKTELQNYLLKQAGGVYVLHINSMDKSWQHTLKIVKQQ